MNKILVIFFTLFASSANSQIISLFAGGGSGTPVNGVPATSISLEDPVGGAFDKSGNYYFASDLGSSKVFKIDVTGRIFTIAGTGTSGFSGDLGQATAATLYLPNSVAFDSSGNLYICDAGNNRIRKIDATSGIVTTIAGSTITGGFSGDNGPATSAMFYGPSDICFDKFDNLYIADATNQRIRKVSPSGMITTIAGTGIPGTTGDNGPATAAEIHLPIGLCTDGAGNLYIAGGDHVVRKINTSGIITTVAGVSDYYTYPGDGVPATNAPIDPIRIGIDQMGQLVIADYLNFRIFRVNLDGIIYTIAGNGTQGYSGDSGPAINAEFNYPSGVAFDSCGNLYIPTTDGHVRKVSFNPACWPEEVKEVPTNNITIYPNRATTEIHIDNITTGSNYAIVNIVGIIEQSGILKEGSNTISVNALPAGIYLLELTDEQGKRTVKKVVKE